MSGTSVQDDGGRDTADHLASSDETGRGYLTGPGLVDFPVEYAVADGRAIYQGCIDMGPVDEVRAAAADVEAGRLVRDTTAYAGSDPATGDGPQMGVGLGVASSFLWEGARVPYAIAAGVPNTARVDSAVAHLEQNTGIRFVRRTAANAASHPNWVEIVSNGGESWSSSAIGMRGGRQELRLADGHSWPILVHEFLHALGVYHEQSRSDRDDFVEVRWANIQDGPPPAGEVNALGNFQKQPGSTDYFDYDYGSLMHYGPRSFAKDPSQPTLVPRRAGVTIGQRTGMSPGDRQTVAKMYERFFLKGWSGVWRSGTGAYGLWANATWDDFHAKWQQWSGQGLRLVDVHVRQTSAGPRFSGVFLPGSGGQGLWANASWDSFRAKWQEWSAQGLRLHDLHVHRENGQDRYTGVFLPGTGGHGLWVGASWDSFRAKWQEWSGQGLRLHDLHVHSVNGQDRYTGVFLPGTGGHGLWAGATWASFVAKWQEWSGQGLRLVDLNAHRVGTETRWSGVFLPGNDAHLLWANVTFEGLRAKWEEMAGQGLRLVDLELVNPPAGALFDAADGSAADAGDALDEDLEPFGGILSATPVDVRTVPGQRQDTPRVESGSGAGGLLSDAAAAGGDGEGGAHLVDEASAPSTSPEDGSGGAVLDLTALEDRSVSSGQGFATHH